MDMDDRPAVYKLNSEPPDMTRDKLTQEKTETSEEPSSGRVGMVLHACSIGHLLGETVPVQRCLSNQDHLNLTLNLGLSAMANGLHHRGREASSVACRCYAVPDSSDEPLGTSTILPVTPPFPSNSCACLASARGSRCAMSGLIFRC